MRLLKSKSNGSASALLPDSSRLFRDDVGSLLPMAAMGFLVIAGIVGGGLDMSRAHKAENRLQAACDAAALAGRRAVGTNGFDSDAQAEAARYFDNNFNPERQGAINTTFTPTPSTDGNTISGVASADVKTTIMRIFGFDTIAISVTCEATMGVGNSDITMVLDSTGSMSWELELGGPTKISILQDAMKLFYDTVQTSTAGTGARIRYAFVPYSSSVNVGRLLDQSYLVDELTIQSRLAVYETVENDGDGEWKNAVTSRASGTSAVRITGSGTLNSTEYSLRDDCNNALPADTAWSNSGTSTTDSQVVINAQGQQVTTTTETQLQTQTIYTCVRETRINGTRFSFVYLPTYTTYERDSYDYTYETRDPDQGTEESTQFSHFVYQPVEYDVSRFKSFSAVTTQTGTYGADVSSTWEGCIEERETTPSDSFNYNSNAGITPAIARDLDIDSAPVSSNDETKWAPMWPEVAFYRTSFVTTSDGYGYYDLTNNRDSDTGGPAPSFCPYQAQLLQTMTEAAFDAYADSLIAEGATYHDIGLLWGARLSSPEGIFRDTVNTAPANGSDVSRHMIFMTDGLLEPNIAVQSAYGIEFHDRRVTADGVNEHTSRHTSRFLAICEAVKAKGIRLWVIAFATGLTDDLETCSSENSSFTANDADQLNTAFQEIANEVGELRINR